jgi:hypothetical protein
MKGGKFAYARNKVIIQAAKEKPCVDCGKSYPSYVMDFDHVRGDKLFGIGGTCGHKTHAKLLAEIDKCDVVCANCHRERTHRRGYR